MRFIHWRIRFWIVSFFIIIFPCHQLIDKCIASLNDFGYFLNLPFLNLFVESFLILSIFRTAKLFVLSCNVEFFGRRTLKRWHLWTVGNLWLGNWLFFRFNGFFHFFNDNWCFLFFQRLSSLFFYFKTVYVKTFDFIISKGCLIIFQQIQDILDVMVHSF